MLRGKMLKLGFGCLTLIGMSQATPIHQTTQWQSIGKETIATAGSSNNGVFYSLDGGTNWDNLTSGMEFSVGQTVDFKVEIYKEFQGTHYSDVAKVWLDDVEMDANQWLLTENGNTKDFIKKDTITTKQIDKITSRRTWSFFSGWRTTYDTTYKYVNTYTYDTTSYSYYDGNVYDGSQNPITDLSKLTYLGSIGFTKTFTEAKDYELIARAMCSDDLSKVNTHDENPVSADSITYIGTDNKAHKKLINLPTALDWEDFTTDDPVSTLQGEIESYTFTVRDVPNVPEPASLSLMLLGLTSLTGAYFIRKRK